MEVVDLGVPVFVAVFDWACAICSVSMVSSCWDLGFADQCNLAKARLY